MSWIAPWFLLGIAGVALPLWLHRLQQRTPRREPFSSAMLLEADQQRLRVRKQLRYRWLLAARIALLVALALAFAQPLWRRAAGAAGTALQLIVLDSSASMSAPGRFAQARAEAQRLIDAGSGPALLFTAADQLEPVAVGGGVAPSSDRAALHAAVAALDSGVARLDYGAAVAGLDGALGDQRGPISAHLISDFQDSGLPTRFADLLPLSAPSRHIELALHALHAPAAPNWAITGIERNDAAVQVTVRGFATLAQSREVTLEVNGVIQGRAMLTVPADGSARFRFDGVHLARGENRVVARLSESDALAADNVRYAVMRDAAAQPVAVLSERTDSLADKYLATALAASGGFTADVQAIAGFDARRFERYRWLIVPDLGALSPALATALQGYLERGGALFAALGERTAALRTLPVLGDALAATKTSLGDVPLGVGQVDTSHPLLNGLRGWDALSIGQRILLSAAPADRVLVSAGDGSPLLLERRIGRGRVLLYASSLDNDWNDLPVQPLFVGLMAETARYLSGEGRLSGERLVGTTLSLGAAGLASGQIIDPSGRTLLSLSDTRRAPTVKLEQPGFYEVYTQEQQALVAVNLDPRESDLTPMSATALQRWRAAAAAGAAPAGGAAPAAAWPLAPWLLLLLGLVAVAESLLGNLHLLRGTRAESI